MIIMKNLILRLIASFLLVCALSTSAAAIVDVNLPIKLMYAEPDENSEVVFAFPLEIVFLSMTEDLDWYRVKIRFEFMFAPYEYIGWVYIPVGSLFNLPKLAPENIP